MLNDYSVQDIIFVCTVVFLFVYGFSVGANWR